MKAHLVKVMDVEAAHRNPRGGAPQQRLHGHSYRVEILASGTPDDRIGWVVDFAELKHLFEPIYAQLDHACLNEVPGLEEDTTLPALQRWIESRLQPAPPWLTGVRVSIAGDLCFRAVPLPADAFRGLPGRLRFTFEAAQSLPDLPRGHHCRNIHGHSYRMEIGAGNLSALEPRLRELHALFDHQYLNEIPGLESATCERICAWIWDWLAARNVTPTVVSVQETESARCLYFGER